MSKKNSLARRKRQHEFELRKEQQEREKKEKKLQAKKNKMKVDFLISIMVFCVVWVLSRSGIAGELGNLGLSRLGVIGIRNARMAQVCGNYGFGMGCLLKRVVMCPDNGDIDIVEFVANCGLVDGSEKKKKGRRKFQVGKKKVKTKLTALTKAKAAQAMEIDK
ncbi:hypothetical protein AKJ16_DCAP03627 [Drosera capensis]